MSLSSMSRLARITGRIIFAAILAMMPTTLVSAATANAATGSVGPGVPPFTVRPGYRVTLVAKGIANCRFLEFDGHGRLFVSEPGPGRILVLSDKNHAGYYTRRATFLHGFDRVQAMVFRDGWLWFATSTGSYKTPDDGTQSSAGKVTTILTGLPGDSGHWWRSLCVTRKHLYTSVGDQGNIDPWHSAADIMKTDREKIWRYNLDGTGKTLWCTGIRNTEKLLFRPATHELWGCDEGSDQFGHPLGEAWPDQAITDHNPPDEFNHYIRGGFYGHPFITGNDVPRYEYVKSFEKTGHPNIIKLAGETVVPAYDFGAHWSTVSFCFFGDNKFHGAKTGDAMVCCHGSWDSVKLVGYRLQLVKFDPWTGKPDGSQLMVSTLGDQGKKVLARPVNCLEDTDGSVIFSSDTSGSIYRLAWVGTKGVAH